MIDFRKNKSVIMFPAIAMAGLILCFILYMPLAKQLSLRNKETKTLETELIKARNVLISVKIAENKAKLVNEENLSVATDELIKRGGLYHLNLVYTKPGEPVREKVYVMQPIDMVVESGYSQLGDFLGSLDDLEKSVVKVDEFDMAPSVNDPSKLKVKLTLSMYVLR